MPRRSELIASFLSLAPFGPNDSATVVELACGEGFLAAAFLKAYPGISLVALDGSAEMREVTSTRLSHHEGRVEIGNFDLDSEDWLHHLDGAHLVVSSLAIHHLDDAGKQRLFQSVAERLAPGGALLIGDIVHPGSRSAERFFGAQYDDAVKDASMAIAGDLSLWNTFDGEDWNHFRTPDLEFDKPSILADQIGWLTAAGFVADCFWMFSGHALYGGYLPPVPEVEPIPYADALETAREVLSG